MKKIEELIKTPEYWMETIQNELYNKLTSYMKNTGKTQTDISKELKVSKSYISQILNGNFNFTLKKLIELSLYMGVIPSLNFISSDEYLSEQVKANNSNMSYPFYGNHSGLSGISPGEGVICSDSKNKK